MEDAIPDRAFEGELRVEAQDALVAEAAKTEPEAFGELYDRYYTRVYRYVYHRLGRTHDAEDVTALVFMKALEALPSYKTGRSGFAPWIFRIARNAVVDHYRRQKQHSPLEEAEHKSSDDDPVTDVLRNEQKDDLRALVGHLSNDQREVVLMRYAGDLSFAEIAQAVKKNESAVRMLLHRGLRKMKAVIEDERRD